MHERCFFRPTRCQKENFCNQVYAIEEMMEFKTYFWSAVKPYLLRAFRNHVCTWRIMSPRKKVIFPYLYCWSIISDLVDQCGLRLNCPAVEFGSGALNRWATRNTMTRETSSDPEHQGCLHTSLNYRHTHDWLILMTVVQFSSSRNDCQRLHITPKRYLYKNHGRTRISHGKTTTLN